MKEGPSESKENKENREKKGEREASKGHGAANRKGKGASRSRQGMESKPPMNLNVVQSPLSSLSVSCYIILLLMWFLFSLSLFFFSLCMCLCARPARPEENGVEVTPVDRGSDRGRRLRGGRGEHMHNKTLVSAPNT